MVWVAWAAWEVWAVWEVKQKLFTTESAFVRIILGMGGASSQKTSEPDQENAPSVEEVD